MSRRTASVLLLSSLLAGAVQASALPKHTTVTLDQPAKVGTTIVPAGTYRLELGTAPETARFVQGKRTVVETPVKVGVETAQYAGNAVHYKNEAGQQRLLKIVFAPSGIAVEFPSEAASTGAAVATSTDGK